MGSDDIGPDCDLRDQALIGADEISRPWTLSLLPQAAQSPTFTPDEVRGQGVGVGG